MADYIEREAAKRWLADDYAYAAADLLDKIPAADVAPVVHGRWLELDDFNFNTYYDCSACGESFCFIEGVPEENLYSYCPNCGAKMDLEATAND